MYTMEKYIVHSLCRGMQEILVGNVIIYILFMLRRNDHSHEFETSSSIEINCAD